MKKSIIIAIITLLFFGTLATFYTHYLSQNLYNESHEYLQEIATQTATAINNRINENMTQLETVSLIFQKEKFNQKDMLDYLHQLTNKRSQLKRFGIANTNGDAITSDYQQFNIQSRDYFQKSIQGENAASSTFTDIVDNELINVHSVPIYNDQKEITGVLFATFYTDKLAAILDDASYNHTGYSFIFNESGTILMSSSETIKSEDIQTIEDISIDKQIHIQDILQQDCGIINYTDNQNHNNYLTYANITNNDWYVASVFPQEIVTDQIQQFIKTAYLIWLFIGVGSSLLITYIYFLQKKNKYQVAKLAYEDPITLHYNFNQFIELCSHNKTLSLYILVNCDIKGFKWFNEIYGEETANQLLITVVECLHVMSKQDELYCRESDDHFALLLHKDSIENIQKRLLDIAMYIRSEFNNKFKTSQFYFHFGVFEINQTETDIKSAFKKTQYIKNDQKNLSKDDVIFYKEDVFQEKLQIQQIEKNFQDALMNEEFKVYIQPKVDLRNGFIYSGEALVRWQHSLYGLISPGTFIPIFETNGMLEKLDTFILEQTLKTLQKWRHLYDKDICISINVSRSYIFNEGYIDGLLDILSKYDILPQQIEIEITETTALNHKEELISILEKLKKHHLRIALDDFGSGYSSLNMLKDLPIDVVKIDQEFFRTNTETYTRSRIIIEEVIELCHKLDITVVAEGVETQEQNDFLKTHDCDYIQGYYYFKPMPLDEFETMFIKK